jgi:hypothetical protein
MYKKIVKMQILQEHSSQILGIVNWQVLYAKRGIKHLAYHVETKETIT